MSLQNPIWSYVQAPEVIHAIAAQGNLKIAVHNNQSSGHTWTFNGDGNSCSSAAWQLNCTNNPQDFREISISSDGRMYAVGTDSNLYTSVPACWGAVYGGVFKSFEVSSDYLTNIMVSNNGDNVWVQNQTSSINLGTGPTQASIENYPGAVWGTEPSTGSIYRWNATSNNWSVISGWLQQVHVSQYATVGANAIGDIWYYDFTTNNWIYIQKPGCISFTHVEAGNGFLWALTTSGEVWYGAF